MKACPFSFWSPAFINKRLLSALPSEFICDAHAWPRSDGSCLPLQLPTGKTEIGSNANKTWWKKPERPTGSARGN